MHRHGYQGRKLHRERDQRQALLKSLAEALIIHEAIQTTMPKAKELVPYVEKLITKAKRGDLAARRQLLQDLQTVASAHKLMDEIAPKLNKRNSGHLKIEAKSRRRGDNAQMAQVSFVDDIKASGAEADAAKDTQKQPKKQQHDLGSRDEGSNKPLVEQKSSASKAAQNIQAPKRTGRRGDR